MADSVAKPASRPWWAQASKRFATQAQSHLRRKFPALAHLHEDLIDETLFGVARYLSPRPAAAPPAWFEAAEPGDDDVARFFALCHAILRRRINDHFRSRATLWIERSAGSPAEQPELASESAELDRGLELRRALAQLLSTVERLPKQEQQLLERAALGDSLGPLSAADRQRLHRLRTRLAAELESTVGANPLEVLGRR